MGKRIFDAIKRWVNLVLALITVYQFIVPSLSKAVREKYHLVSLGWSWQTWLIILLITVILSFTIDYLLKVGKDKDLSLPPRVRSSGHSKVAGRDFIEQHIHLAPESNAQKESMMTQHKIDTAHAAEKLCKQAQEFKERFYFVRYMWGVEGEEKGKAAYLTRQNNAQNSFRELMNYFNEVKWYLDCRKTVEDKLQELWRVFWVYSCNVIAWVENSHRGATKGSEVEQAFGDPADKALKQADDIVEEITQMLTPYIRGEK